MTGLLNVFIYWPGRHNLRPKGRGFSGKIIERRRHQGTSHRRTSPANIRLDEDVFKTSWRRLSSSSSEDVLIKTNMFALALRLQKTSWSRPIYSSWLYVFKTSSRRFQDVFKTSSRRLAKMSSRRFQDVFKTSCKNVFKTSSRRLQDVLKTSSKRLQDVLKNVFKTSSRRLQDVSSS